MSGYSLELLIHFILVTSIGCKTLNMLAFALVLFEHPVNLRYYFHVLIFNFKVLLSCEIPAYFLAISVLSTVCALTNLKLFTCAIW